MLRQKNKAELKNKRKKNKKKRSSSSSRRRRRRRRCGGRGRRGMAISTQNEKNKDIMAFFNY